MSISSESPPGACAAVGALCPPCRAARVASLKGALSPRTGEQSRTANDASNLALESDGLNLVVGRWMDGDGSKSVVVPNYGDNSCLVETTRASGEVIRSQIIFMGLRRPSEDLGVDGRVVPPNGQVRMKVKLCFCGMDYILNTEKATEMALRWESLRGAGRWTWKRLVTPGPLLLARRDLEKSQLNWRPKVPQRQLADQCEENAGSGDAHSNCNACNRDDGCGDKTSRSTSTIPACDRILTPNPEKQVWPQRQQVLCSSVKQPQTYAVFLTELLRTSPPPPPPPPLPPDLNLPSSLETGPQGLPLTTPRADAAEQPLSQPIEHPGFGCCQDTSACSQEAAFAVCRWMARRGYPRVITAFELLQESDDDSIFCGPPSEPGDVWSVLDAIAAWVEPHRGAAGQTRRCRVPQAKGHPFIRMAAQLVLGRGELVVDENSKFVGYFDLGLEDDDEFCLVKRVLGKGGQNMRSIAGECSAKLRLRGIGSGFLEGREAREASMPLQVHISCNDLDNYMKAIGQVGTLLKDLYKHYRRYATSKGMTTPELKMRFEELRRDDHGLNQFESRSDSQKARDRLVQQHKQLSFLKKSEKPSLAGEVTSSCARSETTCLEASFLDSPEALADASPREEGTQGELELYSGRRIPVPATAAGLRRVARLGGARCASLAAQAAREVQQRERDRPIGEAAQTWAIGEAADAKEEEKHRAQVHQRGWESWDESRGGEKRSGGWGKIGKWDDEWGEWDEWSECH
ncbi:unnamed protein product [Polarella glacialis]|uniref:KHDC4/BBP-like KH-domain type I domain-containing protein n=1 Tax=Polarella glacialis TaxID=89957 RepID=A0A813EH61_POLGL|nr:unnamed protein product [Polarella glacialis]